MPYGIKSKKYVVEPITAFDSHIHGIKKIMATKQSKYQKIQIIETCSYGRCLFLDGKLQSSETDEFIFHESLVHPGMLSHPNPEKVFIIGGGEGATLRDVLLHRCVKKAVMVDIDEDVVELSRKHLPKWHNGAFDDPRSVIVCTDARKHIENERSEKFDVVISDLTEPLEGSCSYMLYTEEFYKSVKRMMNPGGMIILQAGTTNYNNTYFHSALRRTLGIYFKKVRTYQALIPSFDTVWGFIIAWDKDPALVPKDVIRRRIKNRLGSYKLKYYDEELHGAVFTLPKYLRGAFSEKGPVIRDNRPVFSSV